MAVVLLQPTAAWFNTACLYPTPHQPRSVCGQMIPFSPDALGGYSFGAITWHPAPEYQLHRSSSGPWHWIVVNPSAVQSFRTKRLFCLSSHDWMQSQAPLIKFTVGVAAMVSDVRDGVVADVEGKAELVKVGAMMPVHSFETVLL